MSNEILIPIGTVVSKHAKNCLKYSFLLENGYGITPKTVVKILRTFPGNENNQPTVKVVVLVGECTAKPEEKIFPDSELPDAFYAYRNSDEALKGARSYIIK